MSDTDPYAAPESGPNVLDADGPAYVAPEQAPDAAPVAVEATEEVEVPEGSIKTVLAWVGDDKAKAAAALDAEKEGQKRTTLTKELEEILAS
ncbi:hypothetical protein SEA_ATUIN_80 [Arthrobacter phage Atuin]|nr:hypothetical protein SEA_ATUIN_179 [Arthrobacter phage Atuin]